jgi:hypothetical protein
MREEESHSNCYEQKYKIVNKKQLDDEHAYWIGEILLFVKLRALCFVLYSIFNP